MGDIALLAALGAGGLGALLIAVTSARGAAIGRGALWLSFVVVGFMRPPGQAAPQDAVAGAVGMTQALTVVLPAVCLFIGALAAPVLRRSIETPEKALLIFVGVAFGSAAWSVAPADTAMKSVPIAVQSLTIIALARRYDSFDSLLRGFTTFVHVLLISVGIGWLVAPGLAVPSAQLGRLQGLLPAMHPNMLGLAAVIGILACVTRQGPHWLTGSPQLRLLLGLLYVLELYAARARSAQAVGFVALLLVLAFFARHRRGLFAVGILALGSVAAFAASRFDAIFTYLQRGQTEQQFLSLSGRSSLWDAALSLWREEPLTGYGYYVGHRTVLPPLIPGMDQANIDSMWIESLLNVGLIGVLPLAVLVIAGTRRAWRNVEAVDARAFTLGALVLMVSATFFNPSIQTPTLAAPLLGALLIGSGPPAIRENRDKPGSSPLRRAVSLR